MEGNVTLLYRVMFLTAIFIFGSTEMHIVLAVLLAYLCLFCVSYFSLPGFSDSDVYAKQTLGTFAKIPTESTLWEKISLCSDVMEGAWYVLYHGHKKSSRREKIKKVNPGKH